mgnify:FL=1
MHRTKDLFDDVNNEVATRFNRWGLEYDLPSLLARWDSETASLRQQADRVLELTGHRPSPQTISAWQRRTNRIPTKERT